MSLHQYNRKRRFDQTPEPAGDVAVDPGQRPIFVVQLHHASSRHYDFRLEADGVLKSWAVPKGPSLRPGEKRLAVEVEDHPLSYATFEGDIPEGHYGAGHVDVYDHGTWACDGDPLEAIAAGKVDFVLHGTRLNGAWTLVRTAMRGRQRQWLLIKRTDAVAADADADSLLRAAPAKAGRDRGRARAPGAPPPRRRADATWKRRALALEKARGRPYPPGFQPQLATLRSMAPDGEDWLHEIKWDGYRLLADVVDGVVTLRSRGGQAWSERFPDVVAALRALPVSDLRLDGELVVLDAKGRSDFTALQRVLEGSSRAPLRYVLFDMPGIAGVDLTATPLLARKQLLRDLLGDVPGTLAYSDHVIDHGPGVFVASGQARFEGIVSKRIDAAYKGGRSADWVKTKHEDSDEFIVVGHTAPKGSRTGFGSLLLATREGKALRYVGRVGTGFDDALLATLTRQLKPLAQAGATVELPDHVPFSPRSVRWVAPRMVVEVAFRGWAKEGLLRQASFKRLRDDKRPTDVGAEAPAAQSAARSKPAPAKAARTKATRAPAPRATASRPSGSHARAADAPDVTVSHPERVVYPKQRISKGDVAAYYLAMAPWILPGIAGRPLSLLRCPDGVDGSCFFQKHHGRGLGDAVRAVPLAQKSGTEDYVYIDDAQGLLQLVQMNTLELHPWGATVDDPEHADRLVFDLDPGEGVRWPQVRAAAREIRARLQEVGLESFVRLSGGKGLHVVVPLQPAAPWQQARDFCEAFAQAMSVHAPDRYVATMAKAKRKGLIFIDWLRNTRGATSVCSWSLRARDGAGVAVPLRWDELGRVKASDAFPMAKARQRAQRLKADPWEGIATLRQALPG